MHILIQLFTRHTGLLVVIHHVRFDDSGITLSSDSKDFRSPALPNRATAAHRPCESNPASPPQRRSLPGNHGEQACPRTTPHACASCRCWPPSRRPSQPPAPRPPWPPTRPTAPPGARRSPTRPARSSSTRARPTPPTGGRRATSPSRTTAAPAPASRGRCPAAARPAAADAGAAARRRPRRRRPRPRRRPPPAPAGFVFSPYKDITISMNWNTNVISTAVTGTLSPVLSVMPAKQTLDHLGVRHRRVRQRELGRRLARRDRRRERAATSSTPA